MLPIIKKYRDDVKTKEKGFIFQKDNDSGHGTQSKENLAQLYKD
jgi:hypothetical protein